MTWQWLVITSAMLQKTSPMLLTPVLKALSLIVVRTWWKLATIFSKAVGLCLKECKIAIRDKMRNSPTPHAQLISRLLLQILVPPLSRFSQPSPSAKEVMPRNAPQLSLKLLRNSELPPRSSNKLSLTAAVPQLNALKTSLTQPLTSPKPLTMLLKLSPTAPPATTPTAPQTLCLLVNSSVWPLLPLPTLWRTASPPSRSKLSSNELHDNRTNNLILTMIYNP